MEYFNREKCRFELGSVGARNKIIKYLENKGFKTVLIEDTLLYTVKVDRLKKYEGGPSIQKFQKKKDK